MLLRKVKQRALKAIGEDFRLVDFSFALPYTYVLIEGRRRALGVAMTLPEEVGRYRSSIEEPSLEAFIERADSINVIERTLGMAAINALSQYYLDLSGAPDKDVVELLGENPKVVAVIGNMPPVVSGLRRRGFEVLVFERNPKLWDRDTLSDALEYDLLPEADAVVVSGSAVINGSIDMILERSKKARALILTGPTAQLHPDFLRGSGVTHLASMSVTNVERALLKLKLGSFRGFEGESRKYVLEVEP
ncbi:hypothetical protein A3L12_07790 [Thermococcus sp. P6]|uniref:Rossmann-like domain-containing protein n=1 Tax=Thermococcus sp. P6 TaxID=122420 RepID=UPI000B5A1160|nr:DUF364 domain-containing protein [Thermococcus sp. P6]ASJ11202.1 hypothetical protein A3L12_07790 [Thermococcus sp. P6]